MCICRRSPVRMFTRYRHWRPIAFWILVAVTIAAFLNGLQLFKILEHRRLETGPDVIPEHRGLESRPDVIPEHRMLEIGPDIIPEHRGLETGPDVIPATYRQALQSYSSHDRNITLIYVDDAFADMAINQYYFSILPLRLSNTLFISPTPSTCEYLMKRNAPCYFYRQMARGGVEDIVADRPAVYGSANFWAKVGSRPKFVYEALQLGYTVFHIDADVLLFKDPWNEFTCATCDMEILNETLTKGFANVGTVLNRPTPSTLGVYRELVKRMERDPNSGLQKQFNDILVHTTDQNLKYRCLDVEKFQCGKQYFTRKRMLVPFAAPCPECVLIHNNMIYTKEAKVYRFKENLMWVYDDDGYYSSTTARYIQYDNPPDATLLLKGGSERQLRALANALALGRILDRIVILPVFFCPKCDSCPAQRCSLISFLSMAMFERVFRFNFRESTFLLNPMVPQVVVRSKSPKMEIASSGAGSEGDYVPRSSDGATSEEIKEWFQPMAHIRILQFGNLYGAVSNMTDDADSKKFWNDIKRAFVKDIVNQKYTARISGIDS